MWLFDQTGLRRQELITGSKLRSAIVESRKYSSRQRHLDLELVTSPYGCLSAGSPKARIKWGEMVCQELANHFHLGPEQPEPEQRVFLVTLCDRRCCTSHQEKNIDIRGFVRILRRGLRGVSYLGMLEPAYYVNVCEGARIYGKRMVSWHLHLLAWGESPNKMKTRIDRVNDRRILLPIADGLPAGHQKCISKEKLASKIAYMLKAPQNGYRLAKINWVMPDGKVVPKFRQFKAELRPGERLTLFRLMADMYLDQLAVAGGEGADILRRLKRRAARDVASLY